MEAAYGWGENAADCITLNFSPGRHSNTNMFRNLSSRLRLVVVCTVPLLAGCASATSPTEFGRIVIGQPTPAAGSMLTTSGTPPGAFIQRGSGVLSIPISLESGRDAPWAQLNVYLMTADGTYCGQNLPDAPTWGPLEEGEQANVTITGFQVYRLPCNVTGVRAMLHTRNNGLLTPPTASETIADALVPVSYTIR
jgi:hypothetical protein